MHLNLNHRYRMPTHLISKQLILSICVYTAQTLYTMVFCVSLLRRPLYIHLCIYIYIYLYIYIYICTTLYKYMFYIDLSVIVLYVCMLFRNSYGAIPQKLKVPYHTNCRTAHPGLCRLDDAINFSHALLVSQHINKLLLDSGNMKEGDWFSLSASADTVDGRVTTLIYLYLAHMRWRDPKIALITRTHDFPQHDGSTALEVRNGSTLDQLTVYAVVRELLN